MSECKNPDSHETHICQLKVKQQFEKVRELSRRAQYYCGICETESNDKNSLCDPREFKGKPGVLRWR